MSWRVGLWKGSQEEPNSKPAFRKPWMRWARTLTTSHAHFLAESWPDSTGPQRFFWSTKTMVKQLTSGLLVVLFWTYSSGNQIRSNFFLWASIVSQFLQKKINIWIVMINLSKFWKDIKTLTFRKILVTAKIKTFRSLWVYLWAWESLRILSKKSWKTVTKNWSILSKTCFSWIRIWDPRPDNY
jgi:hypothetical protein